MSKLFHKAVRTLLLYGGMVTLALLLHTKRNSGYDQIPAVNEPADSPADLTQQGWRRVLLQTKVALRDKQLGMLASGLAYHATLTFFPVVLGIATIYATVTSPHQLANAIHGLQSVVPPAIYTMVATQLGPLTHTKQTAVGIAAVLSVVALLWTTSGGLQSLIKATNIAYDVEETRGTVKVRLTSLLLSVALLSLGLCTGVLLLVQASALTSIGLPHTAVVAFPFIRWPLLVVIISVLLAGVYRYAPNRQQPYWQWVSWGATAATLIWLAATALFFLYVQKFGNFNKTYGTFAGIVILMSWFNLSALIILVGAQVNKKLEDAVVQTTTA